MAAPNPSVPADPEALAGEVRRLQDALDLAERDRQLLGYEIHDGIIQDLTAAAMLLEGASRQATFVSQEVAESHAGGLRLLRESIGEARRIIRGLATVELDEQGLTAALTRLVAKFRADLGVPVTLACDAGEPALPASARNLLLRIAQEALFNIWKHAQATRVEVGLKQVGQQLELTIADNGAGFRPESVPSGHYGVEGMRARARILGAALDIESAPGQGTRIAVRLKRPPAV